MAIVKHYIGHIYMYIYVHVPYTISIILLSMCEEKKLLDNWLYIMLPHVPKYAGGEWLLTMK